MNIEDVFDYTSRQTIIRIDNADVSDIYTGIHSGSMKLQRTLCENSNDINFGGCVASQFEATIEGIENLVGQRIRVLQRFENEEELSLFKGIVNECELQDDRQSYRIVAYDELYSISKIDVMEWYRSLDFPIMLSDMLSSLLNFLNIYPSENLVVRNDFLVSETVFNALNGVDVLKAICEVNGGFGIIDENGEFNIIYLEKDYGMQLQALSGFELSTYETKPITKVIIRATENDIGGEFGSSGNTYIMQGNFLVFGKSTKELNNIAETLAQTIAGLYWRPCEFDIAISNPLIGITGERYNIITSQGDDFYTYIFNTTFSDVQLLSQTLSCYGEEERSNNVSSTQKEMMVLQQRTFEISRTVDGMNETVSRIESTAEGNRTSINEINTTVEGITIKIEDIQKQLDGDIVVYTSTETPTLDNYPATDWFIEYYPPANESVAEDYHFPGDYTWQFSYDEFRKHIGSIVYVEGTNYVYRFILNENKQFEWKLMADTELSYLINQIAEVRTTVEGLSSTVSNTELVVKNNTSQINKNTSSISQNATNIATKVSKNNIISEINQSAETVSIKASKINLNGLVTANSNFKILSDGSMEAKNGKFGGQITSNGLISANGNFKILSDGSMEAKNGKFEGRVTSSSGTIAGWKIQKDALYKDITLSDGTIRRVYIKSSSIGGSGSDDWIFSIQERLPGSSVFTGSYIVRGDGTITCNTLNVNGGETVAKNFKVKGISRFEKEIQCDDTVYAYNGIICKPEYGSTSINAAIKNSISAYRSFIRNGLSLGTNYDGGTDKLYVRGNAYVEGSLRVTGTKNRIVDTEHYGKRALNAYEMATPMFGDIGTATLDENGECIIYLDDIFREVIDEEELYQVFLQSYSEYVVYVEDVCYNYFKVKGHPNKKFAWEIKGKQKGYANLRLEEIKEDE